MWGLLELLVTGMVALVIHPVCKFKNAVTKAKRKSITRYAFSYCNDYD